MKKSLFFFFAFLLLLSVNGSCDNTNVIIKDVRGEIYDEGAEIIIESNSDFAYLDYTLQNPPQIIIDPIGKVYSDLKDTITFNEGPIKRVMVVKGKTEGTVSGNFYLLDFISIELSKPMPYVVNKHNELTVEIGRIKGPEVSKLLPIEEEEAMSAPEQEAEQIEAEPLPAQEEPASVPVAPEPVEPVSGPVAQEQVPVSQEIIPLDSQMQQPPQMQEEAAAANEEQVRLIYAIGEGDTLDISVWQHPDLDRKVVVRPDGYVTFPLVGDLRAVGYKPPELASSIKENLARLIKDPQVTVIVAGFGSKNIFVLGEVDKPGAYP
ncbi:MAG: polysaccharide biosynthesis/export family protein, partial [Candidatus Omnitrophica bacterium]|nr:polysaccharide biosynthesis/export family protein [Candidatus Omnitrophota bacterium]